MHWGFTMLFCFHLGFLSYLYSPHFGEVFLYFQTLIISWAQNKLQCKDLLGTAMVEQITVDRNRNSGVPKLSWVPKERVLVGPVF